jgi:Transposase DDE domain
MSYALPVGDVASHGPHRQAVGSVGAPYPGSPSQGRRSRPTLAGPTRRPKRHPLDTAHRSALEGPSRTLPSLPDLPPPLPEVDRGRGPWRGARSPGPRPRRARANRSLGVLHRRHVRRGQKRGPGVGKTKRGKGTKIMALSDGTSVPLALHAASASPHEITLVGETLASAFLGEHHPERLIGDKAYDSDPLDETLAERGIEVTYPTKYKRPRAAFPCSTLGGAHAPIRSNESLEKEPESPATAPEGAQKPASPHRWRLYGWSRPEARGHVVLPDPTSGP